jgi:hypothetical protein
MNSDGDGQIGQIIYENAGRTFDTSKKTNFLGRLNIFYVD